MFADREVRAFKRLARVVVFAALAGALTAFVAQLNGEAVVLDWRPVAAAAGTAAFAALDKWLRERPAESAE